MARMYSKKRGRAGSKRPFRQTSQSWVRYKPKEVELLIGKKVREGKTASQIGIALRDTYGIPSVKLLTKKSISSYIKKDQSSIPDDLLALLKKSIVVKKHMETNKQDMSGVRGVELTESHIRRMIKYYKRTKRLSPEWKYDPAKIKLLIE